MSVHEFEKDYKAQLSLTSGRKIPQKPWEKKTLSQVFEEIVSWCINGQTEELNNYGDDRQKGATDEYTNYLGNCSEVRNIHLVFGIC